MPALSEFGGRLGYWWLGVIGLLGDAAFALGIDRPSTAAIAPGVLSSLGLAALLLGAFFAFATVRRERDEARGGTPPRVWLTELEPVNVGGTWQLRLALHNQGKAESVFYARVERLVGGEGPEPPWPIVWRHGGARRKHPIPAGSSEKVLLATAGEVDVSGAREIENWGRWHPGFYFPIAQTEADPIQPHAARFSGVASYDDVLAREMQLTVKFWHDETGQLVDKSVIGLSFWERDDGQLVPRAKLYPSDP